MTADDFRRCEFCGCNTNAKMRACCAMGRVQDLDASMAASIARFMDPDQSDLAPEVVELAQQVIDGWGDTFQKPAAKETPT
jgi:hypothetical protein